MNDSRDRSARGLISDLGQLVSNGLGLVLCRLQLAGLELAEARDQMLKLAWVFSLAIVASWFAIAYGTVLIVYLTWNNLGWKILGLMALAFAVLATGLLFYARAIIRRGGIPMSATMAELRSDCDLLL
jgi:uncharacterized membrane protein YqjE